VLHEYDGLGSSGWLRDYFDGAIAREFSEGYVAFSIGTQAQPRVVDFDKLQTLLMKQPDATYSIRPTTDLNGNFAAEVREEGAVKDIAVDQIIATIKIYKTKICGAVGKGEVTLFLKAHAGAEGVVISASAESGIEAKIQCPN
jgi:hypothetical protein